MLLQRRRVTPVSAQVQLNPHLFIPHFAKKKQATHAAYIRPPSPHCISLRKVPLQWAMIFHTLPALFHKRSFIWIWKKISFCLTSLAQALSLVWIVLDFAGGLFALWSWSDIRAVSQRGEERRLDAIQSDTSCTFIRNMHFHIRNMLHFHKKYAHDQSCKILN